MLIFRKRPGGVKMVIFGILIGIAGTLGMDIWALVAKHVFRLPVADLAMVGRWAGHMPRGRYFHTPIAASDAIEHELAIGWCVHYVTGIAYGVFYLFSVRWIAGGTPSLFSALVFGLVTLAAPWFIMQPAFGLGILASKAPRPWRTRWINLSMHLAFALAMYAGWKILALVLFNQWNDTVS